MNQETFTCETCHNVYPIQSKVMHSIHCKPVPQQTTKPKIIEKQPQTVPDIDKCPKCGIAFPKNEMNDHLLAHISEEEQAENGQNEPEPIVQQEQHENMNQYHRNHQQIPQHNQIGMDNTNVNYNQGEMPPNYNQNVQNQSHITRQIFPGQNGYTTEIIEETIPNGKKTTKITRDRNGNICGRSISSTSGGGSFNSNSNYGGSNMNNQFPFSTGNSPHPQSLRLSNINFNNIQDDIFSRFNNMYNQLNTFRELLESLNQPQQHPVPEQIINELPEVSIDSVEKLDGDKKDCVICLTPFAQGDKALILPCIHFFHIKCIKDWFKTQNTCPICKFKLDSNSMEPPNN